MNHDTTLARLLAPVSATAPAGSDISYSALSDQIREARRSDDAALDLGEWQQSLKTAEWNKVLALCDSVLTGHSKDLQTVVWYAEAQCRQHGFDGLPLALRLLDGWLAQYWQDGYPALDPDDLDDLDERCGKLEWLNTQLAQAIAASPLTAPEHGGYSWQDWQQSRQVENLGLKDSAAKEQAIAEGKLPGERFDKSARLSGGPWFAALLEKQEQAWQHYQQLQQRVDDRFGQDAPALAAIRDAISAAIDVCQRLLQQCGGSVAAEKPEPRKGLAQSLSRLFGGDSSPPAPPPAAAPATAAALPAGADSTLDRARAVQQLRDVAAYFRQHEPHSPVALLAERAARWADMSLEDWLAHVIKDDATLAQLNTLLDIRQP